MGHSNCDHCGHDKKMCSCEDEMTENSYKNPKSVNWTPDSAPVKQIGGDHYQASYQHWDWVADAKVGYFEANATKYMSRWWKKGGAQDIEKAYSYVRKMYELLGQHRYRNTSGHVSPHFQDRMAAEKNITKFFMSAEIPPNEKGIIHAIANWRSDIDLLLIMREMDTLYMDASAGATLATGAASPAPPAPQSNDPSGPAGAAPDTSASGRRGGAHPVDGQENPFGYDGEG